MREMTPAETQQATSNVIDKVNGLGGWKKALKHLSRIERSLFLDFLDNSPGSESTWGDARFALRDSLDWKKDVNFYIGVFTAICAAIAAWAAVAS